MTFETLAAAQDTAHFAGVSASELATGDVQRNDGSTQRVFAKLMLSKMDPTTCAMKISIVTDTNRIRDARVLWERELRGPGAARDFVERARVMLVQRVSLLDCILVESYSADREATWWHEWDFLPPDGINFVSATTMHIFRACVDVYMQWRSHPDNAHSSQGAEQLTHAQLMQFPYAALARELAAQHVSDTWIAICDDTLAECEECDALLRWYFHDAGIALHTAAHWLF